MNRDTAVRTWREVCGSDTVMALGVVTGRMLEDFANRIAVEERKRLVEQFMAQAEEAHQARDYSRKDSLSSAAWHVSKA